MEERLAKLEKRALVNQILLSVILVFVLVFLGGACFVGVKAAAYAEEIEPTVKMIKRIDFEALESGLEATQALSEAGFDYEMLTEAVSQLKNLSEGAEALKSLSEMEPALMELVDSISMLEDFHDALPQLEELAKAVSAINEKLDKIGFLFGK